MDMVYCLVCANRYRSGPYIDNDTYVCYTCKQLPEVEQFILRGAAGKKIEAHKKDERRKVYMKLKAEREKYNKLHEEFKDETSSKQAVYEHNRATI